MPLGARQDNPGRFDHPQTGLRHASLPTLRLVTYNQSVVRFLVQRVGLELLALSTQIGDGQGDQSKLFVSHKNFMWISIWARNHD